MESVKISQTKKKIQGTILIVDDDDAFRPALSKLIESHGARVLTAENGKAALQVLQDMTVDLIISDIQMPIMNGVELTKQVRQAMSTPIILMTAFSDILESREAYLLGANDFFAKPIQQEEFFAAIDRSLSNNEAETKSTGDEEFVKISIEDFISGREIAYSIFIKLSPGKFIKIAHKGEDLELDRVRAYKSKEVHHLYLRSEDFKKYISFNLNILSKARASKHVSQTKKLNLVKHTGEVLLEQINHSGLDQTVYTSAATFIETTVQVAGEDSDILDLLDILNSHSDFLYAHSVGVSVYSVMLARSIGWTLPTNLFKVSMSGLLHDVGKKEINRELLLKPRKNWGPSDVKVYEKHPQWGYESLRLLENVPEEVLQVVLEHHEDCTGNGFPSRRMNIQIHPMAKLISVADKFCDLIIQSPNGPGCSPEEAFRQLLQFSRERLDPKFLGALMAMFRFKPPPDPHGGRRSRLGDT